MLVVPLIFILLAIVFPKFTRFMLTLFAFGLLFVVASCIDHAKAASDVDTAFQNCMNSNATLHRADLFKTRAMGGNDVLVLAGSCNGLLDAYMHECQMSKTTEKCFIDVKLMSYKAIQDSMN